MDAQQAMSRTLGRRGPVGPLSRAEQRLATSVLVIGTGGSGLRAAIQLAERGTDVLVVGKRPCADAHTTLAAGGINAALGTMDPADSWQQHAADTISESYFLADPHTVRIVAEGTLTGLATVITVCRRRAGRGGR